MKTYETYFYKDIYTKNLLLKQLQKAASDLQKSKSDLFFFNFAGLQIEIDSGKNDAVE